MLNRKITVLLPSLLFMVLMHLSLSSIGIASPTKEEIKRNIHKINIPFILNQGQAHEDVRFYAKTFGGTVFITKDGQIVYALPNSKNAVAIKEELIGAKVNHIQGEDKSSAAVNYFKGIDQSQWKNDIATYKSVNLGEVYKGIELKLKAYGNNIEKLFYVNPGASPDEIRIKVNGANGLSINEAGELVLNTELGDIRFTKPVAYQGKNIPSPLAGEGQGEGNKIYIDVAYVVNGNEYGFKIGDYDRTRELVIDPLLASIFIGGSGEDYANSIAIDSSGNIFITGTTWSSDYPVTAGAYDTSSSAEWGLSDAVVLKLSSDLSSLTASTFIGGNGGEYANGIAIDSSGNIFITGSADSSDYPVTSGAYDTSYNGGAWGDIFISKLSNDISSLIASTYIGSSSTDGVSGIAIDSLGNVFVAGYTSGWTSSSSDYPVTAGAYDTSYNGGFPWPYLGKGDAFVSKVSNDLSSLVASTFIGGEGYEYASGIAIDSSGNVFVTGYTVSPDYPVTAGAYDTSYSGHLWSLGDAFVSKLNNDLSSLTASTFIGGSGENFASSIAIDTSDNVFVTGWTDYYYPVTASVYDTSHNGGSYDAFVAKFSNNLSSLTASTFIGGSGNDYASSIAINSSGNVFVAGYTFSSDYPVTTGAYDISHNGNSDIFVSNLSNDLSSLTASTYIGGSSDDYASGIAIDSSGNIFVIGWTGSSDYPVTTGAYDISYNSGPSWAPYDAFVSKFTPDISSKIEVTEDIINTIDSMLLSGEITSTAAANTLISQLTNAQTNLDTNPTSAVNMLQAAINFIEAQSGKKISSDAAQKLINYINSIIASVQ